MSNPGMDEQRDSPDRDARVQRPPAGSLTRRWHERWLATPLHDLLARVDAFEARRPGVDVIERRADMIVEAELPGVRKADVEVFVEGTVVTIRVSSGALRRRGDGSYHTRERSSGYYSRSVILPAAPQADAAAARIVDGLLRVTLPKASAAGRRRLEVR